MSYFRCSLGNWYIKCYKRVLYVVVTSDAYPSDVAIECIDELYESIRKFRRTWGRSRRHKLMEACCRGVATKYGTLQEGSAPHAIITEMQDDVRRPYSEQIVSLLSIIDKMQVQVNQNMKDQLVNMENTDQYLQRHVDECREMAKAFKKRANKLKYLEWYKNKKWLVHGTLLFTVVGGVGGFMLGGPGAAAVLTSMNSVAAAQALEAAAGALIFGAAFLGANSACESWFLNQKFKPINGFMEEV